MIRTPLSDSNTVHWNEFIRIDFAVIPLNRYFQYFQCCPLCPLTKCQWKIPEFTMHSIPYCHCPCFVLIQQSINPNSCTFSPSECMCSEFLIHCLFIIWSYIACHCAHTMFPYCSWNSNSFRGLLLIPNTDAHSIPFYHSESPISDHFPHRSEGMTHCLSIFQCSECIHWAHSRHWHHSQSMWSLTAFIYNQIHHRTVQWLHSNFHFAAIYHSRYFQFYTMSQCLNCVHFENVNGNILRF